jgi:uncharacterized cupin superfamily protein
VAAIEVKSFDSPDETREFEGNGHADVVTLAGKTIGRGVYEPGWRWTDNVKPIAGTDTCQVHHVGYALAGRMKVTMDDGSEREISAGEVFDIPPGHDAEVVGDETFEMVDFGEFGEYAKR